MKTTFLKTIIGGLVCAGLWGWGAAAWAQDEAVPAEAPAAAEEAPAAVDEPAAAPIPETEPVAAEPADAGGATHAPESAVAETNAPAEAPAAAEEETPAKPKKKETTYRGSDMQDAFKGAGSSRFGISGRVNKMPAKKTAQKEAGAWKRSLEIGMSTASGNSDVLRYDGALSAARETEENYLFLKAAGRYGESDNETDTENATGEGKFQHRLSERNYAALDANAHRDPVADLDYRVRGSLSLGRHIAWTERAVFSAELGPGYVAEEKGGEKEGFLAGRAAQYLEILVTDSLQIWQSAEFVQNLEDSAVYFVNAEVGLETVLVGNLSLKFAVEDRYDSRPADDKESNDLLTTTSLAWKF